VSSRFGYVKNDTILHRLNPALKLFMLISLMIGIIIYPSWRLSIVLLLIVFIGFRVAKVPMRLTKGRTKFVILFSVLLLLVQVLITTNGVLFGFLIPQIGDFGPLFPITDFGIVRGLAIASRFLLLIFSSMFFVSITDPTLLAHSLTKLRIPYRYSFSLVIALRFLPLFDLENHTVRMAQKSRGIIPEVAGLRKIIRTIQYTFFPLLVSALSRVDSLSMSMDGRGFGYSNDRSYLRNSSWRTTDTLVTVFTLCFLVVCILLALGHLPGLAQYI
jgi:energy-coupling factor transport system permease protein